MCLTMRSPMIKVEGEVFFRCFWDKFPLLSPTFPFWSTLMHSHHIFQSSTPLLIKLRKACGKNHFVFFRISEPAPHNILHIEKFSVEVKVVASASVRFLEGWNLYLTRCSAHQLCPHLIWWRWTVSRLWRCFIFSLTDGSARAEPS